MRTMPNLLPTMLLPRTIVAVAASLACTLVGAASDASVAQRTAAARATAERDPNCTAVKPFYWSVGDAHGVQADGRVGLLAPTATTEMPIASASKLVYASFIAQQRAGQLSNEDVQFLTFTSGYTEFKNCTRRQTIAECDAAGTNGAHDAANDGRFYYNGGHMERHAVIDGLGPLDDESLARTIDGALGTEFHYSQPQLAGGIMASPAQYGDFLRRIVDGQLRIRELLGTHAVCTNPGTCPTAVYSPVAGMNVHYSIGHWVEDEPGGGDGAYSSAGAFGFYPWIDHAKTTWGIVARFAMKQDAAVGSWKCGRDIRAAWESGKEP